MQKVTIKSKHGSVALEIEHAARVLKADKAKGTNVWELDDSKFEFIDNDIVRKKKPKSNKKSEDTGA